MRIVDRVAYINHDIDDAIRAGHARAGRPAARGDRAARRRPARAASTRSSTTSSRRRRRRATSCRATRSAARCSRCASFMFERVYLGPHSAEEHARDRARPFAGSSTTSSTTAATTSSSATDYLAGMTDRFALAYAAELDVVARIKDSLGRGGQGRRGDRRRSSRTTVRLRKAGGTYKGLCPFHQERTPSFTVTPARGTFKCFGCGEGGDAIAFVEKIEQRRLRRRDRDPRASGSASSSSTRRRRPRRSASGGGASGSAQLLERATAFYERDALGQRAGRVRARVPRVARARRGGVPRVPARLRARRRDCSSRRARQEGYDAATSCSPPGSRTAAATTTSSGGSLFPLADARGGVRGFQARKLHDDDPLQAKYVNSPESELFRKGDLLYGLDTARAGDREGGPRGRRRGEHRRARAAAGRASCRSSRRWGRRSPSGS